LDAAQEIQASPVANPPPQEAPGLSVSTIIIVVLSVVGGVVILGGLIAFCRSRKPAEKYSPMTDEGYVPPAAVAINA